VPGTEKCASHIGRVRKSTLRTDWLARTLFAMRDAYTGPVRFLDRFTVLRGMRYLEGLSQEELAAAVGTSRRTISSLERARSTPSLTLAVALAQRLDVSVEELFPESDRR